MERPVRRVVRVLSNNAVLTRVGDSEMVLVGRGIGFGRGEHDVIDEDSIQQRYAEVDPQRVHVLDLVNSLSPNAVEVIAQAVELAADALGGLHPGVHVLLLDHIAFAIDRVRGGETIDNPLTEQIRQLYPQEFDAAAEAVGWLNRQLQLSLPDDEAGFIALHLNAARTGESVKRPLQRVNELAQMVDELTRRLNIRDAGSRDAVMRDLVVLSRRLRAGRLRDNGAQHSIRRDLPAEHDVASSVLCQLLGTRTLTRTAAGEAAFLAVQVHGWRQDAHLTDAAGAVVTAQQGKEQQ